MNAKENLIRTIVFDIFLYGNVTTANYNIMYISTWIEEGFMSHLSTQEKYMFEMTDMP